MATYLMKSGSQVRLKQFVMSFWPISPRKWLLDTKIDRNSVYISYSIGSSTELHLPIYSTGTLKKWSKYHGNELESAKQDYVMEIRFAHASTRLNQGPADQRADELVSIERF